MKWVHEEIHSVPWDPFPSSVRSRGERGEEFCENDLSRGLRMHAAHQTNGEKASSFLVSLRSEAGADDAEAKMSDVGP